MPQLLLASQLNPTAARMNLRLPRSAWDGSTGSKASAKMLLQQLIRHPAISYSVFEESIAAVVTLVKTAIFEQCDSPAKRLLEFDDARELLIESFSLLDAVDIGSQRFGQIDCGEYLHGCTFDASIVSPQILILLVIFVTPLSKRHTSAAALSDVCSGALSYAKT